MNSLKLQSREYVWMLLFASLLFLSNCGTATGQKTENSKDNISSTEKSSEKDITAFSIDGEKGNINKDKNRISVKMPANTDITKLIAVFEITGVSVEVNSKQQISGVTINDFTEPVIYKVISETGESENYTVTVSIKSDTPSEEEEEDDDIDSETGEISLVKAITAFSLDGVTGTINETAKTISVTMPNGTDVTALVATFTTTGTSVKIGSTTQASGVTANNFTNPVTYTVTAADSSTADYTVTVTVAASSAKAITTFSLDGVTGTINETTKTISVTMPTGTSVTSLVATFTTTGTSVKIGTTIQASGVTANNFTSPLTYTVTAADSSTADYTVTVTVAASSAKAITAFSLDGVTGTINETTKTISVTMPTGTSVTALVATFTTTGTSVKIGSSTQASGVTANNFTSPVTYTVTAADSSTADYTVTVTVVTAPVTYKLSDTGQTACYNGSTTIACPSSGQPFYGQDANYAKIKQPSYTDNGNGTITDNVTTLMWQKEDDNMTRTWADALTYCDNLTLAGFLDWRLPARTELEGIVDSGVYLPAINTIYFPSTNSNFYWSATTYATNTSYVWFVHFFAGLFSNAPKYGIAYVMCVRGGQ